MKKEYIVPTIKVVETPADILLSLSFGQDDTENSGNASLSNESVSDESGSAWSGAW